MASIRKIALLRGINVGGKNKVKMQDLVSCLSDAGLDNVRTYIQSGNIAFDSRAKCGELETRVHQSLQESFGFDVSVMVRTDKAWGKLVAENPFCDSGVPTCDVKELHVTLLGKKPTKKAFESLAAVKLDGDRYELIGDRVYLRIVNGYSKDKANKWASGKKARCSGDIPELENRLQDRRIVVPSMSSAENTCDLTGFSHNCACT